MRKRERSLADYAAQRWVLPGAQELVRQRFARAFTQAGLAAPMIAVETESLSLKLATLCAMDCLGLSTSQILTQENAQGIVPIEHNQLQFRREAGVIRLRHADLSPSVKLLVAELRKIAVGYGPI